MATFTDPCDLQWLRVILVVSVDLRLVAPLAAVFAAIRLYEHAVSNRVADHSARLGPLWVPRAIVAM